MGLVNISLPKFIDKSSIGFWNVSSFSIGEWNHFIDDNSQKKPLIINQQHEIKKGFINLTPPNEQAIFGVWMEVWPR
ncbi:hypothetical protein [Saccharicrinis fermentans]|uniref:Uncharacterized protein n=2 Tax=Saccharicrinis fermentans TaxID=982 RepID=W7Y7S1_9BACT|nr:hypothetical protein [Saccharicrinis fermentans]GAF04287.1 hypothetical protein JCM21142_72984 [Saccharicrinis fermentans DSM 9555 = JCM 21142]